MPVAPSLLFPSSPIEILPTPTNCSLHCLPSYCSLPIRLPFKTVFRRTLFFYSLYLDHDNQGLPNIFLDLAGCSFRLTLQVPVIVLHRPTISTLSSHLCLTIGTKKSSTTFLPGKYLPPLFVILSASLPSDLQPTSFYSNSHPKFFHWSRIPEPVY